MTKARDLANAGTALTTVSATELGYLDGVTSAVQTQIDAKQAVVSGVDSTEIGYLDGVTSAIQTQLNTKAPLASPLLTGDVGINVSSPGHPIHAQSSGTSTTVGGNVVARLQSNGSGRDATILLSDNVANSATMSMLGGATIFRQNGVESLRTNADATTTINSVADATVTNAARGGGYMGVPQSAAATTGAYTIVAADAGEHIYSTATRTITIPANASVAFPVGTAISFIAATGTTVTIAITSDTLLLAGPGTTGSRTLAPFGIATAIKITSTSWIISGNGLT